MDGGMDGGVIDGGGIVGWVLVVADGWIFGFVVDVMIVRLWCGY